MPEPAKTQWIADELEALRQSGLFTHIRTLTSDLPRFEQEAQDAARADVERAVLTNLHIDMDYKELSAIVPANVEVGFDGWRCMIG